MWTTITSIILFIFGIAKTENGYVDYRTQEMYNLGEQYTNSNWQYTKEDLNNGFIVRYKYMTDEQYKEFYERQD